MKRILLSCFYLLASVSLFSQTAPIYLLFTRDCMDQLEYHYTYGTNILLTYSVHPRSESEEQFLLTAGQPALTSPSLPPGTLNCREFNINAAFVDAINKNVRPVYIVHQNPQGYTLVPLASASQITRYGAVFQFRTPRYSFAVDTNNLVYEQNLALPGTNAYLYFSGVKVHNCRNEYSFRRVPTQNSPERSDFDYIPGVGITSDRTGKSAAEAENNQVRLIKINGLALEDYITALCPPGGGSSVSKWAGQAGYGPTSTTAPPLNQDKEVASIQQNGGIPAVTGAPAVTPGIGPRPPVNCPETMGPGYHILQPGETLMAVSRTYGVDVKSLVRWNHIKDPNKVQVCQKIWLKAPPTPKSAPKTTAKGVTAKPAQYAAKSVAPMVVNQSAYWNGQQMQPAQTQPQTLPPAQYNYTPQQYNTAEYMAPAVTQPMQQQPQTMQPQPVQPMTAQYAHTVQKGETVSGIARRYNLAESRLRMLNAMPPAGNVTIRPGQRLIVSENSAQMTMTPNTNYSQLPAGTTNPTSGAFLSTPTTTAPAPTQYNTTTTTTLTPTPGGTITSPSAPAQYNTTTTSTGVEDRDRFYETPVTGAPVNQSTTTAPQQQQAPSANMSQIPTQTQTPNYQEYIVKEGETINSIAIKYKANAQELALVNNKEVAETLIAGQRILVPVQAKK